MTSTSPTPTPTPKLQQFHQISDLPKSGIQQPAKGLTSAQGNLLGRKAQHTRQRDDGDEVDDEDGDPRDGVDIVDGDADGSTQQEDVDPGAKQGALDLVADGEGFFGGEVLEEGPVLLLLGLDGGRGGRRLGGGGGVFPAGARGALAKDGVAVGALGPAELGGGAAGVGARCGRCRPVAVAVGGDELGAVLEVRSRLVGGRFRAAEELELERCALGFPDRSHPTLINIID